MTLFGTHGTEQGQDGDLCLVHTADANKTRLSRLVGGVNWVGNSCRQFSVVLNILETEQFCLVSPAVWTHLWTSLEPVSKYDVTIGNHVCRELDTRQDSVHTAFRDWTKLFLNFQSATFLTCHQFSLHRGRWQDKTRQSCLVGVGGVN